MSGIWVSIGPRLFMGVSYRFNISHSLVNLGYGVNRLHWKALGDHVKHQDYSASCRPSLCSIDGALMSGVTIFDLLQTVFIVA